MKLLTILMSCLQYWGEDPALSTSAGIYKCSATMLQLYETRGGASFCWGFVAVIGWKIGNVGGFLLFLWAAELISFSLSHGEIRIWARYQTTAATFSRVGLKLLIVNDVVLLQVRIETARLFSTTSMAACKKTEHFNRVTLYHNLSNLLNIIPVVQSLPK